LDCTTNDEYSALVDEWIRRSDVFLLTCSLTKRKSLEEVEDLVHRIEKIRDVPSQFANMVLVATQCDDVEHREITKQELKNISSKYGISQCFEVSAKTGENVQELFTCAAERGTDILSGHDKLIQKLENGISVASEQKKCNIL
jgi:GTPase SAR1 family protein